MFAVVLLALMAVAGTGGWFCARLKRRRGLLSTIWVLLLFWPYAAFGLFSVIYPVLAGGDWRLALGWWGIGLGYVGLPILAWAGAVAAGFAVGLLKDRAAQS